MYRVRQLRRFPHFLIVCKPNYTEKCATSFLPATLLFAMFFFLAFNVCLENVFSLPIVFFICRYFLLSRRFRSTLSISAGLSKVIIVIFAIIFLSSIVILKRQFDVLSYVDLNHFFLEKIFIERHHFWVWCAI